MATQNNIALVTGASSGIGKATALQLAAVGFTTYATARRPETLSELATAGCRTLALDVTDQASMQLAVQTIEREAGPVAVLVNCAGYGEMGAIEEVGPEAWRKQFETNVFGLVYLTQQVLPGMRAQKRGRIINISSGGGEFTFPLAGAYHASKYALESLSDALRFEVKPFGIEVVVVQPSVVATPLADATVAALKTDPASPYAKLVDTFAEMSRQSMQSGRGVLTPEAVARVIVKAAQSRRPKTRYKVGSTARLLSWLRRTLPDRAWDGMLSRMVKA